MESRLKFYLSLTTRKAQVKISLLSSYFNNFNYRQINLNKYLSKGFVILFGSVTLIWRLHFYQWFMAIYMIFTS